MYRKSHSVTSASLNLPTFSFDDATAEYQLAKDDIQARTCVLVEEKIKDIIVAFKKAVFLKAKKEDAPVLLSPVYVGFSSIVGLDEYKYGTNYGDSQLIATEIQKFFPGFVVKRIITQTPDVYCLEFSRRQ